MGTKGSMYGGLVYPTSPLPLSKVKGHSGAMIGRMLMVSAVVLGSFAHADGARIALPPSPLLRAPLPGFPWVPAAAAASDALNPTLSHEP